MVDTANGLQVLNFDGRLISQLRFQGMQPELLSTAAMAYAADTVAIIDAADTKVAASPPSPSLLLSVSLCSSPSLQPSFSFSPTFPPTSPLLSRWCGSSTR